MTSRSASPSQSTETGAASRTRAVVFHPFTDAGLAAARSPEARLDEACGLAAAIDLEVADAEAFLVARPRPSTWIGAGKLAQIKDRLEALKKADGARPEVAIVDSPLSPAQHRNLEKAWDLKVLDRTALILEIFGARAQTAEGRLQVDLAHLTYQRSRLVRSWTHLERQRGGAGFLGGPGERQIESDRRALADKIDRLKAKIEQVRRTRTLQRAKRKRAPHPVVALVGYTNAGKSTLFNRLTRASVKAQDLLFATLDPTMRAVDLSSGQRIVMSDTVGFISDLPTQLVAAFRATLEEVLEADVIVHVRDAAHPETEAQRADVLAVLAELGVTAGDDRPVIEILNKIDRLSAEDRDDAAFVARRSLDRAKGDVEDPYRVAASAATGEGIDALESVIDALVTADREAFDIDIPASDGAARAWLYAHGDVVAEGPDGRLTVRLSPKTRGQFEKTHPSARVALSEDGARAVREAASGPERGAL